MTKVMFCFFVAFYFINIAFGVERICRLQEPCPVHYKTLGCYKDSVGDRVLPNYIYNERDPSRKDNYGGRSIEWYNWEKYLAGFSCRCAQKARQLGYDLFGIQFYGECWAGKKGVHNYKRLGNGNPKCVGDGYKPCGSTARYCSGEHEYNFVYEIVESKCNVEFVKEGCFADNHNDNARPLANYLLNDRDPTNPSYSGRTIDWRNWDVYLPELACRCANAAKNNGSTYFGLQFYGECWSHPQGSETYGQDGHKDNCVNECFQDCKQHPYCTGVQFSNYVYRLKGACDVNIQPIGCYKENAVNRVLKEELVNAKFPPSPKFYGEMADTQNWSNFFPEFLCKCAREAKIKGHQYFGVSDFGLCYSDNVSDNYAQLGESTNCFEGKSSQACGAGSVACAGADTQSNYVYKINLSNLKKRSFVPARDPERLDGLNF
ncbi:uncharacterized protein LOC116288607 [Actinia tenebrosa]|uniref:Uncharacterized protein LOC116288607 n=1 Tax=Actinia tenebrosa TaxID=6105 RepID=A0A6P8HF99_ACTTE|nr:uncharacterized protein LOC116288607 [Actinia tenebrosa]